MHNLTQELQVLQQGITLLEARHKELEKSNREMSNLIGVLLERAPNQTIEISTDELVRLPKPMVVESEVFPDKIVIRKKN